MIRKDNMELIGDVFNMWAECDEYTTISKQMGL